MILLLAFAIFVFYTATLLLSPLISALVRRKNVSYSEAYLVILTPLLGVVWGIILTLINADAINPQGGGGLLNTLGVSSLMFGLFGWAASIPLRLLLVLYVAMKKRALKPHAAVSEAIRKVALL